MTNRKDELLSDEVLVENLRRLSPEDLMQRNAAARAAAADVIASLRYKLATLQSASDAVARRAGINTAEDNDAATYGVRNGTG